jgi:DNA (cytosine-5)-methyltransferase 1
LFGGEPLLFGGVKMLTVGELFAGIGGIGLGLENTGGFQVKWQVERDEYASKVLAKHWPEVQRFDDVREFPPGGKNNYYVDLIAGGFPCQDISVAGKGEGLEGERSGLFYEIVRITKRLRPKYILLENVAALLIRGMGDVLRELAALGYDAEWHCIPAAAVGAPHRRDRVFIIAYAQHDGSHRHGKDEQKRECEEMERLEQSRGNGGKGHVADADDRHIRQDEKILSRGYPAEFGGENVADAKRFGLPRQGESKHASHKTSFCEGETIKSINGRFRQIWATEPDVGRVANGVPRRVDRLRCLGNAVVPQVAQFIGEMILRGEKCKDS